jgi:hypothetical protein
MGRGGREYRSRSFKPLSKVTLFRQNATPDHSKRDTTSHYQHNHPQGRTTTQDDPQDGKDAKKEGEQNTARAGTFL